MNWFYKQLDRIRVYKILVQKVVSYVFIRYWSFGSFTSTLITLPWYSAVVKTDRFRSHLSIACLIELMLLVSTELLFFLFPTSVSSFLKEWKTHRLIDNEMPRKMMISCFFSFIIFHKVIHFVFWFVLFLIKFFCNTFRLRSRLENHFFKFAIKMWAQEKTLWFPSVTDWIHPCSVERWKRQILKGERWM